MNSNTKADKAEQIFQDYVSDIITGQEAREALEGLSISTEAAGTPLSDKPDKTEPHTNIVLPQKESDIAVIGISARFPGADNVRQFWRNICDGRDEITEVPKERWDIDPYYHPEPDTPNKSYSKWGGFLKDVDKFDPLYFGISPGEAEVMDPQQRLLLEEAYHTIEDAGYDPAYLSKKRCGVFIGSVMGDYIERNSFNDAANTSLAFTGLAPSILAGRISYFLDLKGPAISIDTACSSSLVAIIMACRSIMANECDTALAGGVSLMHSPILHIQTSQAGMLSKDGRCKAFSNNADGIALSEGVGIVLLKPLKKAIEDNDHIYGVIKGWGTNQDGHTNGITAPSAEAQTALELHVYKEFNINPENIRYVEAHGTGTKLGDPIEIKGLTDAFREYTKKKRYCAIGSVKSNIGHTTMAAGVAGLIKALLSLKYQVIPPTIHCNVENEHIDFKESPFYLNREIVKWEKIDNTPRLACVSSFGYSGTNAHVVIEEHLTDNSITDQKSVPVIILLSAEDKNRLHTIARTILNYITTYEPDLIEMAYTLQTGRKAMPHRIAFKAQDLDQVKEKISRYLDGEQNIPDFLEGEVKTDKDVLTTFTGDEDIKESIRKWILKGKISKPAELWVKGLNVDWNLFYGDVKPKKISLPTYPFARERYWIEETTSKMLSTQSGISRSHPLIHENTSTFEQQQFTSIFTGEEFYLKDHVVLNEKVLPGVVYLEMALAATLKAGNNIKANKLRDIVWAIPIKAKAAPQVVNISLYPETEGIAFEVTSEESGDNGDEKAVILHSQGMVIMGEPPAAPPIQEIQAIKDRCAGQRDPETFYRKTFRTIGFNLGASFQGISQYHYNPQEVLAKLEIPELQGSGFYLHPGILDNAFQASMALILDQVEEGAPYFPFVLKEVEIFKTPLQEGTFYIHGTYLNKDSTNEMAKFNISLLTPLGETLVSFKEMTFRQTSRGGFQTRPHEGPELSIQSPIETIPKPDHTPLNNASDQALKERLTPELTGLVSNLLKIELEKLDITKDMSTYGFDSIMVTKLINRMNKTFNLRLMPTLFFEHNTLASLIHHLITEHKPKLRERYGINGDNEEIPTQVRSMAPLSQASDEMNPLITGRKRFMTHSQIKEPFQKEAQREPIAIVGMAGTLPEAENLEQFWENLISGKDCITEIPKERWDWRDYYGDPVKEDGRTNVKWGGFMKDVDKFDPLFFNISPREAEFMDPQQRLFLQCVWHTIEQAGYNPGSLRGTQTGLFVGVETFDYNDLMTQNNIQTEAYTTTGIAPSMVVNRISFLLDFHGPSESVSTACSSSLVAIHRALRSISNGDCTQAIAGGVSAIVNPKLHIGFSKAGMLCEDGRCKTFSDKANGYVRGEGVGAIMLKPLSRAKRDGDTIYAVIRGSRTSHGGHVSSLTAPNPKAQAELLKATYEEADISPDTVAYIEAHGTGTSLGDPIEINGLKMAFKSLYEKYNLKVPEKPYCGVGSVKSNIGHLETAAGIAGILKVILSIRNNVIPPTLHCDTINPYIDIYNTPFYIAKQKTEWPDMKDSRGNPVPKRAGVSSFGFGGAYAHIVVEEYIETEKPSPKPISQNIVIPLSAKNRTQLKIYAQHLFNDLNQNKDKELANVAYTLQAGREAMNSRLAFIVKDMDELTERVAQYLNGEQEIPDFFRSEVKSGHDSVALLTADEDTQEMVQKWIAKGKVNKLAELWVRGLNLDWNLLYGEDKPGRISLPTYPFAKQRYWIPETNNKKITAIQSGINPIHPLIHENTSTLEQQQFTSTFNGAEFFLKDHQVLHEKVLPGAAYPEMALAAAQRAINNGKVLKLKDIFWASPIKVNTRPQSVKITLFPEGDNIVYEVTTESGSDKAVTVHSQGKVILGEALTKPPIQDIQGIRKRCVKQLSYETCYRTFRSLGLNYGPGFQGISELHYNDREVLAKIEIAEEFESPDFYLHPGILDSAFQAGIGLALDRLKETTAPYVPFALKEAEIFRPLKGRTYVYVTYSNNSSINEIAKYDMTLLNDRGETLVTIKELTSRQLRLSTENSKEEGLLFAAPQWRNQDIGNIGQEQDGDVHLFLIDWNEDVNRTLKEKLNPKSQISFTEMNGPKEIIKAFKDCFFHIKGLMEQKPEKVQTILVVTSANVPEYCYAPISGLLKTARLENPKIQGKIVQLPELTTEQIVPIIEQESQTTEDREVRYLKENLNRQVKGLVETNLSSSPLKESLKRGGVYWITGGLGGLGRILTREFGKRGDITLILSGRRESDETEPVDLQNIGAVVEYIPCDVSDPESVIKTIKTIEEKYGHINGIIHSAGVIKDNFILKKSEDEIHAVMAPKVYGTWNIDQALKESEKPDFILFFSSIAGVMGNMGQADYGGANAFLDGFSAYKNSMESNHGTRYISINWPLWKEGGMEIDESSKEWIYNLTGLSPLPTSLGVTAFTKILASWNLLERQSQYIVCYGNVKKICQYIGLEPSANKEMENFDNPDLQAEIEEELINLSTDLLKVKREYLDREAEFSEYGLDSILMIKMLDTLETKYGQPISPNIVLEHPTIKSLAAYLVKNKMRSQESEVRSQKVIIPPEIFPENSTITQKTTRHRKRFMPIKQESEHRKIAVISMACRLPESPDIETFWENLAAGRDLIREVDPWRWDPQVFFSTNKDEPDKTYTNHGGFLDDIAGFDAAWFGIRDEEALTLDPQQRIMLELSQELFDRGGFNLKSLSNTRTSIFIGAANNHYIRNGCHLIPQTAVQHTVVNNITNMIAARISDFYNLKGNSQTIDTACSSSLVAVHEACQSIINGEADMAVAGGIYLIIDPFGHINFSKAKVLSDDGKSYVFDERANGFVLGEGAGLVLLKEYEKALEDDDMIHGLILGSAVNNDGKTMGLTVPNQEAQKEVIQAALDKSRINPETITCLEAHGTGTLLGDPIEIKAATEVYRKYTQKTGYCALGSVKSNLGHTMTAAGITGLIKILLSMNHKQIPPTIHCDNPHPRFGFDESPFTPNTKLIPWTPLDGVRRGAISSFGFGGTNCHLILEEGPNEIVPKRRPLPLTQFNRRQYWLGYPLENEITPKPVRIQESPNSLIPYIEDFLKKQISHLINVSVDHISVHENFMDMGIDSHQLIGFVNRFEQELGIELYPTLFFEYQNIDSLARFFATEYKDIWERYFFNKIQDHITQKERIYKEPTQSSLSKKSEYGIPRSNIFNPALRQDTSSHGKRETIAIIGMAGLFGESPNLNTFWDHLYQQTDLIKEIPPDHFDYRPWFAPNQESDRMYCKWGSFIDDVDKFDAPFFNISPKEAELMDPQLRHLLQVLYHTAEDAGYITSIKGSKTGIYVGVCSHDYWDEMARMDKEVQAHDGTGNAATMLSNRPSFHFNLTGPSLSVDTACSSSLYSVHLACKAIQNGECEMAFAAGVNLLLSSRHYRYFCSIGALSPTGRCHTFDKRADGYVPGEAVASVLLKPLSKAITDGDHIYGIIKGSAVTHGGYTPSITAPSVDGEVNVLTEVWKDGNISPETLSYIEAHGTGTKLGDPVEVNALKKAFGKFTQKENFCALGSVKAHIGHGEGAAGIAGLVKVLLSMKHRTIPAMPDFKEINPYIEIEGSPFYINQGPVEWTSKTDAHGNPLPLRAGISSFGFGGAYAHMVVEAYNGRAGDESHRSTDRISEYESSIVVLSARNEDRLKRYAQNLVEFLSVSESACLADISYTLLTGREAMEERLAVLVETKEELVSKLRDYINGNTERRNGLYMGSSQKDKRESELLIEGRAGKEFLRILMEDKQLSKLAHLWVSGVEIDWALLYPDAKPNRISLPAYPFAKERYWMSKSSRPEYTSAYGTRSLHPLISENSSTLQEQKFTTWFTGTEFYLSDHIFLGRKVLPGVAYIEMVRAAGELAKAGTIRRMKNIVWLQPVVVEEKEREVDIRLHPDDDEIAYEVSMKGDTGERVICSQGKLHPEDDERTETEIIDIGAIKSRCDRKIRGEKFFELFKDKGFILGKGLQGIKEILYSDNEAISLIQLPDHLNDNFDDYALHPALMDGAVQTTASFTIENTNSLFAPFSLEEIEIINPLSRECYAYVKQVKTGNIRTFDIQIIDLSGNLLVYMHDLNTREISGFGAAKSSTETSKTLYFKTVWEKSDIRSQEPEARSEKSGLEHTLIFDRDEDLYNEYANQPGYEKVILITPGNKYKHTELKYEINPKNRDDYTTLITSLYEKEISPNRIVYLWSKVDNSQDLDKSLSFGVHSLLYLTQALMAGKPKDMIRLLYLYHEPEADHRGFDISLNRAISGFAKTAHMENPKFFYKTVEIAENLSNHPTLLKKITDEFEAEDGSMEVRYKNDQRFIKNLEEFDIEKETTNQLLLKQNGTYLITGGSGGLGFIFSDYLADKFKANLVLTGRSDLTAEKEARLDQIRNSGAKVIYIKSDIAKEEDIQRVIKDTKLHFSKIDGVIHAAGVIKDSFILKKTEEEMNAVLFPKINGTICLDEALKYEKLDFFLLFSSGAGAMGNMGQCDYAYANAFMDNFANFRQFLANEGKRSGKTLSINWPLWKEGGMKVDEETEKLLRTSLGIDLLSTKSGKYAFEKGLSLDENNFMVIQGYASKIKRAINRRVPQTTQRETSYISSTDKSDLFYKIEKELSKITSDILKMKESDIDVDKDMSKFGFDSITLTEFVNKVNSLYRLNLTPALVFEYSSIGSFTTYLYKEERERIEAYYNDSLNQTRLQRNPEVSNKRSRFKVRDDQRPLLPKAPLKQHYDLSEEQLRYWTSHQMIDLKEHGESLLLPFALMVETRLDREIIENAVSVIIHRHEALRTIFKEIEGSVAQIILPSIKPPLLFKTLDDHESAEEEINRLSGAPLDIDNNYLWKLAIVYHKNRTYMLIHTHHIISDFWSVQIFFKELSHLYQAYIKGTPNPLESLSYRYMDYVYTEQQEKQSAAYEEKKNYWQALGEHPIEPLSFPLKTLYERKIKNNAAGFSVELSPETRNTLQNFCKTHGLTPFTLYLTGLTTLLYVLTEQKRIVVGVPRHNREQMEWQSIFGCFAIVSYTVQTLGNETTIDELLEQVSTNIRESQKNLLGLSQTSRWLRGNSNNRLIPPVQVMFSYLKIDSGASTLFDSEASYITTERVFLDFDMAFTMMDEPDRSLVNIEYGSNLFDIETIEMFARQFEMILKWIAGSHESTIDTVFDILKFNRKKQLSIAATFTSEPLQNSLEYWMGTLGINSRISFADFNQVFQELLSPDTLLRSNHHGLNIMLLRFSDWIKKELDAEHYIAKDAENHLTETLSEFINIFEAALAKGDTPYVLLICPEHRDVIEKTGEDLLERTKHRVVEHFRDNGKVICLLSEDIQYYYPITDIHNPAGDSLAAIPYRDSWFSAMGTMIARYCFGLWNLPYKVIVLDGDNTLWEGVVGEDGIDSVSIGHERQALQQKLLHLQKRGVLLCLCSKNIESDVTALFNKREDFILSKEHFAAWKVNHDAKSQSIKALAGQLNLGMDSFIFIDDNPVEIAEVSSMCPEVLCLRFPQDSEEIKKFTDHIWFFDEPKSKGSFDQNRTLFYQQNVKREEVRASAPSYREFIKNLNLKTDFSPVKPGNTARISELTLRTNQFNTTTIRRSEADVKTFISKDGNAVYLMDVTDRFGDYGIVGALFVSFTKEVAVVDSFMVSCRVLGRGVEHEMLSQLATIMEEAYVPVIDIHYNPSPKNQPVLKFLESLHSRKIINENRTIYWFETKSLIDISFDGKESEYDDKTDKNKKASLNDFKEEIQQHGVTTNIKEECIQNWLEAADITTIEKNFPIRCNQPSGPDDIVHVEAETETEQSLSELWKRVLKTEQISVTAGFFALGGSSIEAVEILSRLKENFATPVPFQLFLEDSSIRTLAREIDTYRIKGSFTRDDYFNNEEVMRDSKLPQDLAEQIQSQAAEPKKRSNREKEHVLLTGGTGFLGIYLLKSLLNNTFFHIHCLVRAEDDKEGLNRLKDNANTFNLSLEGFEERIHIVTGDLSQERFDLTEKAYEKLSRTIGRVYHSGAMVNFALPYESLKSANVRGTIECLKFACNQGLKPFHYISTASVFDSEYWDSKQEVKEEFLDETRASLYGGYAQSKWVAERLVTQAGQMGLPCMIYRPNGIGPSMNVNETHFHTDDALSMIMLASLRVGAFFDLPLNVDFAPVDYISDAIIHLSVKEDGFNKIYAMTNPHTKRLSWFVGELNNFGQQIKLVPYSQWVGLIESYGKNTGNRKLQAIMPLLKDPVTPSKESWLEVSTQRPVFDCSNTLEGLKETGIQCPDINNHFIIKILLLSFITNNYLAVKGEIKPFAIPDKLYPRQKWNNERAGKKVIILTWSLGGGHNMSANRIANALEEKDRETIIIDIAEYISFVKDVESFWNYLSRHDINKLNDYIEISQTKDAYNLFQVEEILTIKTAEIVEHYKPDVVISVCPLGCQMLSYIKRISKEIQTITYVSDWFGGCFIGWSDEGADWIYSPSEEATASLIANASTDEKEFSKKIVTGSLILRHGFRGLDTTESGQLLRTQYRHERGISPDEKLLLFNSYGDIRSIDLLENCAGELRDITVIVLCYNEPKVLEDLERLRTASGKFIGKLWLDDMDQWLVCADAIFTKPGPGICAEAINTNTLLFLNGIHGVMSQEIDVYKTLVDQELAFGIESKASLKKALKEWMEEKGEIEKIYRNLAKKVVVDGTNEFCDLINKTNVNH